jgi:hypothetical protein
MKHIAFNLICDPEKSHLHWMGALVLHSIICNTMYRCRWLMVAKILQYQSYRIFPSLQFKNIAPNSASADEVTANFNIPQNTYIAPLSWIGLSSVGICIGFREVGSIRMDVQNHVGGSITYDSIWIRCTIV